MEDKTELMWRPDQNVTDSSFEAINRKLHAFQVQISTLSTVQQRLCDKLRSLTPAPLPKPHSFTSQSSNLWKLLWKAVIHDKSLSPKYVKRDFMQILEGKRVAVIYDILSTYLPSTSMRDIQRFLARFVIKGHFNPQTFLTQMKTNQPFLLYEDIEENINAFRMHFARRNVTKAEICMRMREELPMHCSQKAAVRWMSGESVELPVRLAKKFANYIWKGRKKTDLAKRDLGDIPNWVIMSQVREKIRLEAAVQDIHLEDISERFSFAMTVENFKIIAQGEFALTDEEAMTLTSCLFPESSPFPNPLKSIVDFLSPAWPTKSDPSMQSSITDFCKLIPSNKLLYKAAELTPMSPSNACLSLKGFIDKLREECGITVSEDIRNALGILCYEDTKVVDGMRLNTIIRQVAGNTLADNIETPPVRPYCSEDMREDSNTD